MTSLISVLKLFKLASMFPYLYLPFNQKILYWVDGRVVIEILIQLELELGLILATEFYNEEGVAD